MNNTKPQKSLKGIYFTPREWDVLSCLSRGAVTSKDIGRLLETSPKTVETHISHILTKTQCHSRYTLLRFIKEWDPENYLEQFYKENFNHTKTLPYVHKTSVFLSYLTRRNIILGIAGLISLYCLALWITHDRNTSSSVLLLQHQTKTKNIFIERKNLVDRIQHVLLPGSIVALVGQGGVGKTTLSRLYAAHSNIKIVWEINSAQETRLIASLKSLAEYLAQDDLSKKEWQEIIHKEEISFHRLITFIYKHLNKQPSWLLIFDNVDDLSLCRRFLPQSSCQNGRIIITTRDQNIQNLLLISSAICVEELSLEEAYDLFTRLLPDHGESEKTKKFIAQLPPFPLDISLSAHYIRDTHISFDQYLQKLSSHHPIFHLHEEKLWQEINDYPQTRYALILLTLEKILEINPQYLGLLHIISSINSQDIPSNLLRYTDYKDIVESFIHDLRKFSILTCENHKNGHHSFSLHRSTQEVLKHSLTTLGSKIDISSVIHALIRYAQSSLKKADDSFMIQGLISHFEEIATVSSDKMLRLNLGMLYYHAGQFNQARKTLEDSLLASNIPSIDQSFLDGLIYLGNTYKELKESKLAEDTLQRALTLCRTYFSSDPDRVSQLLISLSYLQKRLGNFSKAEEFSLQSIHLCEKSRPITYHASLASAYTSLAVIYCEQGHYVQAKEYASKSLDLYKEHMPHRHLDHAHAIRILGQIYSDQGLYHVAQEHYLKSLAILTENDQKNHPKVPWLYAKLAELSRKLGDIKQAHAYLDQAENHSLFLSTPIVMGLTYSERSHLYVQQREFSKADEEAQKTSKVYEQLYGQQHVKYARALNLNGYILLSQGYLDQAEVCLLKAEELLRREKSPLLHHTLHYLSEVYRCRLCSPPSEKEIELRKKAMAYIQEAIDTAQVIFPSDSHHTARLHEQKAFIIKTKS